mgnify:CR=1 FL=1
MTDDESAEVSANRLATFLLGLHARSAVLQGPSLGPLLETAVVSEWVKAFRGSTTVKSCRYRRPDWPRRLGVVGRKFFID